MSDENLKDLHPQERFTHREELYDRYRPGYPAAIVGFLEPIVALPVPWLVADIGCGTGKLADLFLARGCTVFGVEPNQAMRQMAERNFRGNSLFHSVKGKAEETGLPPRSVDLIVAGQAFHWFEAESARIEFARILQPRGLVALVWNNRLPDANDFERAYESFLRDCFPEYAKIKPLRYDPGPEVLAAFFKHDEIFTTQFENRQVLDKEGLQGRLCSASYVTPEDQWDANTRARFERLFAKHQSNGTVTILYETEVSAARLR